MLDGSVKQILAELINNSEDNKHLKFEEVVHYRMLQIPVEQKDIDDNPTEYVEGTLGMHKAIGILDKEMNFLFGIQFFHQVEVAFAPTGYKELTDIEFERLAVDSSLVGYGAIGELERLISVPLLSEGTIGATLRLLEGEGDIEWDLRYVNLIGSNPFLEDGATIEDDGFYTEVEVE